MILSNYKSTCYLLLALISLQLLLSFSAKAENSNYSWKQDSTSFKKLSGTVVCYEGLPLGGLELRVFPDPGKCPEIKYSYGITNEDGSFEFIVMEGESYLMEVQGVNGAGRIFISGEDRFESIEITYPVEEKVVILHTNDQHFTVNNLAELTATVNQIREKYESVFLFNAGDIFVRHPMRWIVNGRLMRDPEWYGERTMYMINTMNDLGYDLMTLGNHEFAYREPYTRTALDSAKFPLLAANIEITTEAIPPVNDYVVFKTSTWRNMAVLGLSRVNAGIEGIREIDVSETVDNYISLRDSAEVFVALTHIGLRGDYELAGKYPQFDVIVGGHSHDLLEQAEIVNTVLVAQAGGNPHIVSDDHPVYLGKIILLLENGVITGKKGWVIEIEADAESNSGTETETVVEKDAETETLVEADAETGY